MGLNSTCLFLLLLPPPLPLSIYDSQYSARSPHGTNQSTVNFMPDSDVYPPFDIPQDELNVVLCSSDEVYFHTLKPLLSMASPVFKDMFTLPQPASSDTSNDIREGRPVVRITESSATLQRLLSLCYAAWTLNPPITQMGDVRKQLPSTTWQA